MDWTRRKPVRVGGSILVVLLLAVAGVKLFLPAEKVRDMALAQARESLGRDVSVGDVTVSLRGGVGVRLADFAVANPEGFGGESLLTTEALDLKLALRPLFKGEIRVQRLIITAPVVHLIRRADGRDNFTFAPPPVTRSADTPTASDAAAPPLSVANLSLRDGRLAFVDETAVAPALQELRISGLTLGLSLTDPDPGQYEVVGNLAVESIAMTGSESVPVLHGDVDFDLGWNAVASTLDLRRAVVRLLEVPLACTGSLVIADGVAVGEVELRAVDLAVTDLAGFLPAAVAAKLKGSPDSGVLGATVVLALTGEESVPMRMTGTATLENLDLALAQPFLPPAQEGHLGGRGAAELTFAGDLGDPVAVDYHGTVLVHDVSFTESGLMDDLRDLNATLKFTGDEITVQSCRAEFGAGTFDLTGSLRDPFPYFLPPEMQTGIRMKTPHLDFALHTAGLDVDRWLPAASPTGGSTASVGNQVPVKRVEIPADLEFPDLTCAGTFTADTLLYMQVPLTAVRGEVTLRDRLLSIHDVTGAVYHGTVAGRMDIDLNDLRDPAYAGRYQARDIEVDNFASRFAGLAGVVFGRCNLNGRFATRGLDPETIRDGLTLDADAGIANGRIVTSGNTYQALNKLAAQAGQTLDHEQTLRDLATHLSVEQGRVHLNALTTRFGQFGDIRIDGYYGFNGDLNYSGALTLTAAQTDKLFSDGAMSELGKLLGSQRPGRLELPVSVRGTRTDPQVKLDLGAVARDLQKLVVKEQGTRLEDEAKHKLGDLLNKWK